MYTVKIKMKNFLLIASLIFMCLSLQAEELVLRNNFQRAQPGDYIVISANKTQTLLLIDAKSSSRLTIEEVTIPECRHPPGHRWREWLKQGAPGNTSWVKYDIDLQTGQMMHYYSFTKRNWFEIPDADNFLCKLLNLRFTQIPDNVRKRVGPKTRSGPEMRPLWQPQMIVDGQPVKGVPFNAWRTRWSHDNSELSGKLIEVYLPKDSHRYPAYFPYWLQISGVVGRAKVRIIDSGSNLHSPLQGNPTPSSQMNSP